MHYKSSHDKIVYKKQNLLAILPLSPHLPKHCWSSTTPHIYPYDTFWENIDILI